MDALFSLFASQ